MQKYTLFLFLILFGFKSQSQNSVKGLVTDSINNPIAFCQMVLLNASDSSQVKGNLSDSAGYYVFEKIKAGSYFIKFESVGFKSATSSKFSVDSMSRLSLPNIILKNQGINLNEVSVAIIKPAIEFKKGTVILNVENDALARGNTVFELLKRLPGVLIDAQNNITINGAGGVRFLIDDRMQQMPTPQVMDMLQGMSADAVTKIELIKNPPARYDAAGTGGLINIVTKRAKVNGYNGNIALGASMGKRFRIGPNASFNYKSNKLSVFTNFSYAHRDGIDVSTLNRNILTTNSSESINSIGNNEFYQRVFSGSGGIEYDITKTTLIGFYANGGINNDLYTNSTSTKIDNSSFFNYNKTNYNVNDKYNTSSPSLNFSVLQKIDTSGGELKFRIGYDNYTEKEVKQIVNHFYDLNDIEIAPLSTYDNHSNRTFDVFTGKLDLNKTFKNKINLESGLSANLENDYSNSLLQFSNQSTGFFVGDTTFYNTYRFKQNLYAAYTTISRSWDKFGFSTGLRAEQTDVNINYISNAYTYKRNYISLFPSGSIDIIPNKKNSFTLAYSYRIRRPHYGMLNPVRQFNEQLNYNVGNPEIKPQFSHNFTLDYNFNRFINIGLGHENAKDFTFWYSYTPGNSRVNIDTISNLPNFTNSYINLSAQKRIKWYSFQTYWVMNHQTFKGSLIGQDVSSQTTSFYFNINQEIYLPNDFKIQIWAGRGSAFQHGPQIYHARSAIHITINKTFLNQKLNVALGFNDVLYKDYFSCTTTYTNQNFYTKNLEDSRRVRITINYRFGKMQIQQRLNNGPDQGIQTSK